MKKTLLLSVMAITGLMSAQNYTMQTNVVDNSFSIAYKTNSPTNTYGNRQEKIWMNAGGVHFYLNTWFDSLYTKANTLTSNPKMLWLDETTGQMKVTSRNSMSFPWSVITGAPAFLTTETDPTVPSYVKSILSSDITTWNTVTSKFNTPAGTTAQYVRGDGSLATLPVYSAGTGLSLVSGVFTNIMPDQTLTLTAVGATTITGTYPSFSISTPTNYVTTNNVYNTGFGLTTTGSAPNQTISVNQTDIMTVNRAGDSISAINGKINGKVPTSRTLSINGTTFDLSANRSWTVSAPNPTITGTGGTTVTSSGNTFTVTSPTPYTPTTYTANRTVSTATASIPTFTVSSTKNFSLDYTFDLTVTLTLLPSLLSVDAQVFLEYSTNGGSSWILADKGRNAQTTTVAFTQTNSVKLSYDDIPAGSLVRLRGTGGTGAGFATVICKERY